MNRRTWPTAGLLLGLLLSSSLALAAPPDKNPNLAASTVAGLSPEKALALGERMYREGILPSGERMTAAMSGDTPVSGTVFTCLSCHVRSGVGSYEGGVVTLPTNGAKLAQPRFWKYPNLLPEERKDLRLQFPEARPAYTDATLARVLRTGIDPSGRELLAAMPRYNLKDQDMAILIHYLWSLSAKLSPGVDATTIHFATVITDEVSPDDQAAMLVPLNNYVARHNTYANGFANRMYLNMAGQEMNGGYRKLSLSVWRLKGAPATWARQLEAYLTKEPVFALLGGISYREWKPIHAFCESHQLPCLLPLTDLPVISESDWYTQYFSKGYYQEGQAAARYLHNLEEPAPTRRILQIIQDGPEGRDLSLGFRETWKDLGHGAAKELRLGKGKPVSGASLHALVQREQPTTVLLWTEAGTVEALHRLADQTDHPGWVFLSSRLLGAKAFTLPEPARAFTYLTYPYRDPKDEPNVSRFANSLLAGLSKYQPETRISTRAYSVTQVLIQALIDMDRNVYRDNFLDRISMQPEQNLPDYVRLSFGPGQRYASKGCFIMQLGPGPEPKLIPKSEWIIH